MGNYSYSVIQPKVSIAPMVDRTDRHFRYFCRLLTKKTLLYTEMITAQSIINGDRDKILDFYPGEKPLSLQIAGCEAEEIYKAVKLAEDWDYDEINLNAGCPSDRVSGNRMGAVLMAFPEKVADMVRAIKEASSKPVTVKHRIGIEGRNVLPEYFERTLLDSYEDMANFVEALEGAGVDRFIVHARIAILEGLSPKENREVPPLRYEEVYRLKREHPHLKIEINGGIKSIKEILRHLEHVDGVMIGRAAYENPAIMAGLDELYPDGKRTTVTRNDVIDGIIEYIREMEKRRLNGTAILRHTLGLFHGKKGSSLWRQAISNARGGGEDIVRLLYEVKERMPGDVMNELIKGV